MEDLTLKGDWNMGLFEIFKKKSEETSTPKTSGKVEVKFSSITTYQDEVVPVEKRIRCKKPTCNGLVFLNYHVLFPRVEGMILKI